MLRLHVNTDGLNPIKDLLLSRSSKAEHAVAEQIKKDTEPFVPAATERLSQKTKVIKNKVIYPGPYARFLYYGKLMVDPETGSPWASAGTKKVVTDKNLVFQKTVHAQAQSHWFEASMAQNINNWIRKAQEVISRGK